MKKQRTCINKLGLLIIILIAFFIMASCGKNGKTNRLQFWVYGDESELEIFTLMTREFNATYGKDHKIEVEISAKPTGSNYSNLIQTTASSSSGADIFFVIENDFKKWVEMGFMQEMTDYFEAVDDIDISDIPETMLLKYRYDEVNETKSKTTDPLYGLPMEVRPTALYYNESVFEKAGIIIISVDEENMDAWNAGIIPDRRGNYKNAFSKLDGINVPKKGYFRSNEIVYHDYNGWEKPTADEILVFNNRIAMNWDEVEDLSMIFSTSTNPNAKREYGTDYGYYTEWWFNYGWSVGGDCLADLTGNGYWNFSLLDSTPNYKVKSDTYTGEYTGTVYKSGETLELTDKLAVNKGQSLVADNVGNYTLNGKIVGIRDSVKNNDNLIELPSTKEAFERYVRLGTKTSTLIGDTYGMAISPTPSIFSGTGRSSVNYFYSGNIAMLVEQSSYVQTIAKETNFKWDVAPIAVYKQYEDPDDPYCDIVKKQGKIAGHSNSRGLVSRKKSQNKDAIAKFIMWMASKDGQRIRAQNGFFPNQENLVSEIKFPKNAPKNIITFSEAMRYQTAGDWWYLKSYSWIDVWAVPLNTKLRNNVAGYTYEQWISETLKDTNEILISDYIHSR